MSACQKLRRCSALRPTGSAKSHILLPVQCVYLMLQWISRRQLLFPVFWSFYIPYVDPKDPGCIFLFVFSANERSLYFSQAFFSPSIEQTYCVTAYPLLSSVATALSVSSFFGATTARSKFLSTTLNAAILPSRASFSGTILKASMLIGTMPRFTYSKPSLFATSSASSSSSRLLDSDSFLFCLSSSNCIMLKV